MCLRCPLTCACRESLVILLNQELCTARKTGSEAAKSSLLVVVHHVRLIRSQGWQQEGLGPYALPQSNGGCQETVPKSGHKSSSGTGCYVS